MVVLQAHPSLCSQQGPTWPCLLSSPTATATQQHQATSSRHSPASVTACEHPTTPDPTSTWPDTFLPSVLLSLCSSPASHGLLLTTGATSKHQPTPVLSTIFLLCCRVPGENIQPHWRTFICIVWKEIGPHVCLFFTFHIYDYLFRISFCVC